VIVKKQSCKINYLISVFVGLMVLTLVAGCMAPPTQQIADAQAALEKAKAAGASKYAAEDFKKAEKLLNQALTDNERAAYFEAEREAKEVIGLAQKAEKKAAKAVKGAKKTANFEVAALQSFITNAKGMIDSAKKAGASAKDLADAVYLLERSEIALSNAKSMLETESWASATNLATRMQPKAEEAGSKAFAALQKAKAGAKKKAAKAKAAAKREANFEVAAAGAAIRTAEALVNKASGTQRADSVELGAAKTQLAQARAWHEKAETVLESESYATAKYYANLSRKLAEKAGSSAFKAIAMSKRPTK
jgi:histone H1/5